MKADEILKKAEEIQAAQAAAKQQAIEPLAALLAERIRLTSEHAATDIPYGEAFVAAEAAGWSASELAAIGAEEPTHRPRGRRTRARTKPAAPAPEPGAEIPSQAPVNA
ncbi:hypothetical protein M8Z33_42265 [Streptomyces sp. ZAF1911]|uniref:hypothetical protein n=1 Tax=Streptomyces sp. ZAF1911 TaxID=2944129 RepID=UPI00237A3952|nr:hypothetical protein [Streptomyces sp. ZAF1911]MDD9383165.1 hypothetical protein [Streptomyces sp. ZAF1911]